MGLYGIHTGSYSQVLSKVEKEGALSQGPLKAVLRRGTGDCGQTAGILENGADSHNKVADTNALGKPSHH